LARHTSFDAPSACSRRSAQLLESAHRLAGQRSANSTPPTCTTPPAVHKTTRVHKLGQLAPLRHQGSSRFSRPSRPASFGAHNHELERATGATPASCSRHRARSQPAPPPPMLAQRGFRARLLPTFIPIRCAPAGVMSDTPPVAVWTTPSNVRSRQAATTRSTPVLRNGLERVVAGPSRSSNAAAAAHRLATLPSQDGHHADRPVHQRLQFAAGSELSNARLPSGPPSLRTR